MTSKPVTGYKIKDGKLVRVIRYAAKNRNIKSNRLAKAWQQKSK